MTSRIAMAATVAGLMGLGVLGTACGSEADLATSQEAAKGQPKTQEQKLNLSHIECSEGTVRAHFVLLFAGTTPPADLNVTLNGQALPPVAHDKNTGNVWHYWATLPTGVIESIDASVGATPLHNGAAFVGDWSCDGGMCELDEALAGSFCPEGPLTNPTAECTYFNLVNSGKDDQGFTGTTFGATMSAPLALVKAGNCYNVFVNVGSGETVSSPPGTGPQGQTQNISHVTYCDCPIE
jgi:hypothetical protein